MAWIYIMLILLISIKKLEFVILKYNLILHYTVYYNYILESG